MCVFCVYLRLFLTLLRYNCDITLCKFFVKFSFLKIYLFIWLCWVFVAACRLSPVAESGGLGGVQASHCGGLSCCRASALGVGFHSCSMRAQ